MRNAALAAAFAAIIAPLPAAAETMVVLDASGSMWGQIEGKPKIAIAREVLRDVLEAAPRSVPLGLMAYGHREKGSCADIEVLIMPAPSATAEIVGTVNGLNPRGKTPLTESVRLAAEALKSTERKATVILVTDGLETCNADPCALARALEAGGVDFTAHVVGFGLSAEEGRQVACLAEETGGQYFQAGNAEALVEALTESVAAASEPNPPAASAPVAGPAALPLASLVAPDAVEIGQRFAVGWDGPGEPHDHIFLVDPAAAGGQGAIVRGRRVVHGEVAIREVPLIAPVTPGAYVLEYRYGEAGDVIATRPLAVTEAAVRLVAPPNADIGSTVTVGWVGPGGQRDSVQLFDPAARGGAGEVVHAGRLANGDFAGRTVRLIVPTAPGFYQLRYFNGDDGKVLATREIEVLPAEVSLTAPDGIDMGKAFEIAWVGPGATRDTIQLVGPLAAGSEGRVVGATRVQAGDVANRTVSLTAPTVPGNYLIRYYSNDSSTALATRPITVNATDLALSAPAMVEMGRPFVVDWVGPGGNRDSVEIFDPQDRNGAGRTLIAKRLANDDFANRRVALVAPVRGGTYEIRYIDGDSRRALVTIPLTVEATEVSIGAPASIKAGATFAVTWVGPGGVRDSIDVVAGDRRLASARLSNGDVAGRTVTVKAPAQPGAYVLRYTSGEFDTVLAETPIVVE